jgi:hypothetical protein
LFKCRCVSDALWLEGTGIIILIPESLAILFLEKKFSVKTIMAGHSSSHLQIPTTWEVEIGMIIV